MNCPKCAQTALHHATVGEVDVERCPSCGGAWFDPDELARLLAADRAEVRALLRGRVDETANLRGGTCPRDGRPLIRVRSPRVSSIVVDMCPDCRGVWLDGGEFGRLLDKRSGD